MLTLFTPRNVTRLLQRETNQTHTCYNLISQNNFYRFRAVKVHHQEVGCKSTAIVIYGESSLCGGHTGICALYLAFFDIVGERQERTRYQDGRQYQQIGVGRVAKRVLASNECALCCAMTTKEWCQLAQHLT
jgi:hypothetical protein